MSHSIDSYRFIWINSHGGILPNVVSYRQNAARNISQGVSLPPFSYDILSLNTSGFYGYLNIGHRIFMDIFKRNMSVSSTTSQNQIRIQFLKDFFGDLITYRRSPFQLNFNGPKYSNIMTIQDISELNNLFSSEIYTINDTMFDALHSKCKKFECINVSNSTIATSDISYIQNFIANFKTQWNQPTTQLYPMGIYEFLIDPLSNIVELDSFYDVFDLELDQGRNHSTNDLINQMIDVYLPNTHYFIIYNSCKDFPNSMQTLSSNIGIPTQFIVPISYTPLGLPLTASLSPISNHYCIVSSLFIPIPNSATSTIISTMASYRYDYMGHVNHLQFNDSLWNQIQPPTTVTTDEYNRIQIFIRKLIQNMYFIDYSVNIFMNPYPNPYRIINNLSGDISLNVISDSQYKIYLFCQGYIIIGALILYDNFLYKSYNQDCAMILMNIGATLTYPYQNLESIILSIICKINKPYHFIHINTELALNVLMDDWSNLRIFITNLYNYYLLVEKFSAHFSVESIPIFGTTSYENFIQKYIQPKNLLIENHMDPFMNTIMVGGVNLIHFQENTIFPTLPEYSNIISRLQYHNRHPNQGVFESIGHILGFNLKFDPKIQLLNFYVNLTTQKQNDFSNICNAQILFYYYDILTRMSLAMEFRLPTQSGLSLDYVYLFCFYILCKNYYKIHSQQPQPLQDYLNYVGQFNNNTELFFGTQVVSNNLTYYIKIDQTLLGQTISYQFMIESSDFNLLNQLTFNRYNISTQPFDTVSELQLLLQRENMIL